MSITLLAQAFLRHLRGAFFLLAVSVTWAQGQDTTPPSAPTNLTVPWKTATAIWLSWNASTDNVGVTGYQIFRNGTLVATIDSRTSWTVLYLTPVTTYQFTVRARDAAGNWSAQSTGVSATTWQRVYVGSGTIYRDEEDEDYTDEWHDFQVTVPGLHYISIDGLPNSYGSFQDANGWGSFSGGCFSATFPTGWYQLNVTGEEGDYQVSLEYPVPNQPPTASFTRTPASGRAPLLVAFNGSASSDPGGSITQYAWDFDNNGSTDATGPTTSFTYNNAGSSPVTYTAKLTVTDSESATDPETATVLVYPAGSFSVAVQSGTGNVPYQMPGSTVVVAANAPAVGQQFNGWVLVSGAGSFANPNAASTSFTVGSADSVVQATYAADVTAPTIPTAMAVVGATATSLTLSWAASTDNVAVTGYEIFRNGTPVATIGAQTSWTATGLSPATVYQFTVRARDAAGNWSAQNGTLKGKTWQRSVAGSGTIEYDEWDEEYSEETCSFYLPVAGPVKVIISGLSGSHGSYTGPNSGSYSNGGFTANLAAGWYHVSITGAAGNFEVWVDTPAANNPPVANFTATPIEGRTPLVVTFSGSGSTDPGGAIVSYAWDFNNDGVTDATGVNAVNTFLNNSSHPYVQYPETYVVKLTVVDLEGSSAAVTKAITVHGGSAYAMTVVNGTISGGGTYFWNGSTILLLSNSPPPGMQFSTWVPGTSAYVWNASAPSTLFTGSGYSFTMTATYTADVTPPSAPSNLVSAPGAQALTLTWTAAVDNTVVTGYELFRNGVSIAVLGPQTSYTVVGLSPATIYQFAIRARDAAGNWSPLSDTLSAKTWQRVSIGSGTIYSEEGEDEYGDPITVYDENWHSFFHGGGWAKITVEGLPDSHGEYSTASGSGTYSNGEYTITAASGWCGLSVTGQTGSYQVWVETPAASQPPTASFATAPSVGRAPLAVSLNGGASVDPAGALTNYAWDFDNNGSTDATGQAATTTYQNTGTSPVTYTAKLTVTGPSGSANTTRALTVYPASSYAVTVVNGTTSLPYQVSGGTVTLTATAPPGGGTFTGWTLVSGAGTFTHAASASTTFTLGAADTVVRATYGTDNTAPTAPTALNYVERTAKTVTLVWNASADAVGVAGYFIYRGGVQIGATSDLAFADSGLTANTAYAYTAKAFDAAGNLSAASATLNVTTTQDFTADTDQDGIPNATETALGTNTGAAAGADTTNQTQLNLHRPIK